MLLLAKTKFSGQNTYADLPQLLLDEYQSSRQSQTFLRLASLQEQIPELFHQHLVQEHGNQPHAPTKHTKSLICKLFGPLLLEVLELVYASKNTQFLKYVGITIVYYD